MSTTNGGRSVKRRGLTKAIYQIMTDRPGQIWSNDTLVDALPSMWLAGDDRETLQRIVTSSLTQMPRTCEGVHRVGHGIYRYDDPDASGPVQLPIPPTPAVSAPEPAVATAPATEELICVKVLARLEDGSLILKDDDGNGVWKAQPV